MISQLLLLALQKLNDHSFQFQRVTPGAEDIHHLFIWFMGAAGFVFFSVIGFMVYSMIKYRYRGGDVDDEDIPQIHNRTKVETVLTLSSFGLVILFGYFTVHFMTRMHQPAPGRSVKGEPDIVIIGHQWWWEAKYPKAGFTTANEIHFPVGKRVLVKFKSADVIHDFWVLALGEKIDMFPGHYNHLWIQVKKAGNYWGTCAEYCGTQHAHMEIHVIAQPPKEFKKWEKHEAQPAAPPSNRMEALGSALFGQKACGQCHTIKGNPSANGKVGPDLTHIGSRKTILTFMKNTSQNLHRWIDHPQLLKKGAHMPSFRFKTKQINAVVAYLEGLK